MRCGLIEISKEPHSPPNVTMVFGGDSDDDDDGGEDGLRNADEGVRNNGILK